MASIKAKEASDRTRTTFQGVSRGASRVSQGWEVVDMIIGQDNSQCRPVRFRGWPGLATSGGTRRSREANLARMALPGLLLRLAAIDKGSVPRI
jgi:hypothetical protein